MADSIREQIVSNVRTTLASITVANGYATTVGRVFEGFIDQEALTAAGPGICFEDRTTEYDRANNAATMITLTVETHGLFIHHIDGGEEEARKAGRLFLADIEKALMVDQTRGGKAVSTTLLASDIEMAQPYVHVPLTFSVLYRVAAKDPYATC